MIRGSLRGPKRAIQPSVMAVINEGRITAMLDQGDVKPAPVHTAKTDGEAASILSKHHGMMIHHNPKDGFHHKGAKGQAIHLGRSAREADLAIRRNQTGMDLKESKRD